MRIISGMSHPDDMFDMEGMVALVTGGATGIGWMITQGYASKGAKVYISGRRAEVLEKAARSWKGSRGTILPLPMDVSSKESIMHAKRMVAEREGKLHVLVNNAGQGGPTSRFFRDPSITDAETLGQLHFDNEGVDEWEELYRVNTFPVWFVTMAFLGMLDKGTKEVGGTFTSSVINITSMSGLVKQAQDHFCYNSTKAAASHITKMLATELALKKIPVRVNAIAPGVYESELAGSHIPPSEVDKMARGIMGVPAHRCGTEEEMAGTALYLASRAGCYTNGQEVIVDGGFTAVNPSRV